MYHPTKHLAAHLTDALFRYWYFLSDELFEELHEFKHIVQDVVMTVDMLTRDELIFDAKAYAEASEMLRPNVRVAVEQAQRINDAINAITKRATDSIHG